MKLIPSYIARKNGYSEPEYLVPELEPILKETFGVIVYQEQVIRIATDLAGFSMGQADKFRKAVGKKSEKLIKEQINLLIHGNEDSEEHKIPGLLKNGIPSDKAEELGRLIVEFSKYAFNKSHSAAYAYVTCQTAYLKAHYPVEFMAPLISSYIGKDETRIAQYIRSAKKMGIEVLPPDINKSNYEFSIEGNAIRFGLGAIKGLNKSAIYIVQERKANGQFINIEDLLKRFGKKDLNKKTIDALCLSGTIVSLSKYEDRVATLKEAYEIREYTFEKDTVSKYLEDADINIASAKQLYSEFLGLNIQTDIQKMQLEQTFLSAYISGHPLEKISKVIDWETETYHGNTISFVGVISGIKKIKTKNGDDMAFIKVTVLEGEKDLTLFPGDYETHCNKLDIGGIREFAVQCSRRRDDPSQISYIVKNIKYYRGESYGTE